MKSRYIAIISITFILFPSFAIARTQGFDMLKSMIQNRQNEAKVFIPDRAVIGSKLDIIVEAPGSSKITVFRSFAQGEAKHDGSLLRLGEDYQKLAETNQEKNVFSLDINPEDFTQYVDKDIYFDALVEYQTPEGVKVISANFFGANAAYSNQNSVRIIKPKKDNAGAEALIRSVAPGLINRPSQY